MRRAWIEIFSEFLAASNDADFLERLGVQVDTTVSPDPKPEVVNPVDNPVVD